MQRTSFHDQILKNKIKSFILITVIFIFFLIFGAIISLIVDPSFFFIIMVFSIIFSIGYILFSYYNSAKIAIASVKAKPASPTHHASFYRAVENIALASGLPMPKLYIMESTQINAFASGRDPKNAVICVTTGCLKKLNKEELEGVIAHEMAHIANFDIRFMTLVAVLVGLISIAAELFLRSLWFKSDNRDGRTGAILFIIAILASILAPLLANLVSLAISRKREFTADATAVKFTRYPKGLKNALTRIKEDHISEEDKHRYPHTTAPLFISDPFKKKLSNLFQTHPPIDERIKILDSM